MRLIVFITAFLTLAVEVFYTRLFSALFWRNTAFAILSLAMLGIGASGVLVYLCPAWFPKDRVERQLAWLSTLFGVSLAVSYLWVLSLSRVPRNAMQPLEDYLALVGAGVLPFFFGGLVLSVVFTHAAADLPRLYRTDLVGASLGAVLVLPALKFFNGPSIVPALSLAAVTAGLFIASKTRDRKAGLASAAAALGLIALAFAEARFGVLDVTHSRGQKEENIELERWDPLARLTVQSFLPGSKWLNIDSSVVTAILRYDGDPKTVDYLQHNVLQLAYRLRNYPKVLIVGPGGGSDVLSAVTSGNTDITAVEVNRTTISLMRHELSDFNGGLYNLPAVKIHIADGRAYVASTKDKVDLLQATFVDTFTASASGSHTLSENYLYTVDGFRDFLDHLNENGVLSMSRWGGEAFSFAEVHRAVALAIVALEGRHVDHPERNVVVVQGPAAGDLVAAPAYQTPGNFSESMSTLLVKNSPFTDAELDRLMASIQESNFRPVWLGARGGPDETIRRLFGNPDREALYHEYRASTGLDISPVTDDRPFFFDMIDPLVALFHPAKPEWLKHSYYFARILEIHTLHELLIATTLLALGLLIAPLFVRLGDLRRVKRPASTLGYFICLGVGFIGIELTLMQRFALFLEHPVYSLVVFLSSILLFSGLGSASTARLTAGWRRHAVIRSSLLCGVLVLYGVLLPPFTRALIGLPLPAKMAVAVAVAFPPAYLMGMMFPLGVAALGQLGPELVPWVWGLNSAFSVVGAVLSLFFAMSFGYAATWYVFVGAYALAALSMRRMASVPSPGA